MNVLIGGHYRRNSGGAQYSPTFGRGGDAVLFSVEILDCDASTTGVHTLEVPGIKEEVRLRFSVNGTDPSDTVYAVVLAPQWRPY